MDSVHPADVCRQNFLRNFEKKNGARTFLSAYKNTESIITH